MRLSSILPGAPLSGGVASLYRVLGKTGLRVSSAGVGLWQAGSQLWGTRGEQLREVREAILHALELGVNLFDTAELYGGGASERLLGEALHEAGGDAVVTTKVAGFHTTVDSILKAAEASRRRLGPCLRRPRDWPTRTRTGPGGSCRRRGRC
ncbi:MAG TPA: aldo/keto reductase [Pyrodictium sp.]|nr:aldo/keto reductase [Pyrodictium sp.]